MASTMLWLYGAKAVPIIITACQSTNSTERINASSLLQSFDDPRLVGTIRALFKDEVPQVRYNAVMASARFSAELTDALVALFHDPYNQIRRQATQWLSLQESSNRTPVYVALLNDPDPHARYCAFDVLMHINRAAIPRTAMLDLLGSPILDAVLRSEALLENNWPAEPEFLAKAPAQPPCYVEPITSAETVYLTTNRFILARLTGLKILREHADADSVQLTLPLLRDTNSLVRTRAFSLLRAVTGQDISTNDPAKWEQWWSTNKATFRPPKPTR
jgi:HEAT repeat protein